jgi:capsid protein
MARARSTADRAAQAARTSGKSGADVVRMLEGLGARDFSEARGDYRDQLDAADPNNRFMRRRQGLGGSGDYHIREQHLWYVRETSRHMVLNDDLIGQSLARLADNIVQECGFRLVCNTGDPVLDDELEDMHEAWATDPKRCDFYGERTFAQLQWMLQFQVDQDGDMFGVGVDDGTIQLVEADRCTSLTSTTVTEYLGLIFDQDGKVTGYRFTKRPLGPYEIRAVADTTVRGRYDDQGFEVVMHCYDSRRITQHRGMPIITPVMIKAGMLDDLQFATVVKAQSAAAHAVFFKRTKPGGGAPPRTGARSTATVTAADGSASSQLTDSVRYGTATTLPDGIEPAFATAAIPNHEHLAHVRDMIRQIGAGLGMPLELVLLDASNTNFSGWRGAMDAARMGFRRRQQDRIAQFLTPAHRLNVRRWAYGMGAVARRKAMDGSLYGHRWVPSSWPYINPVDDAAAGKTLLATGQESPRSLLARQGKDFDDVVRETVEDRSAAVRLALAECAKIKTDTGHDIDPFTLLGWDLPGNSALVNQVEAQGNIGGGAPTPGGPPAPAPSKPPAPTADPHPPDDHGDDAAPGATIPAP